MITKNQAIKRFIAFLIDEGCYREFCKTISQSKRKTIHNHFNIIFSSSLGIENAIMCAFRWDQFGQGRLWNNIHFKWEKICRKENLSIKLEDEK